VRTEIHKLTIWV